jgi:pimeloyl-ACP methyl ester carboxylesterase
VEQTPTTTLKMVRSPLLNIGYEQTGSDSGYPILLLHGWPYDPRSYDDIREPLPTVGHRVIVPYLRCFGPTVFRSPNAFRSGQQSALRKDIIDLLDALKIEKATLAGYDWGGRGACVAAALWPERVHALVSATGYTIQNPEKNAKEPGNIQTIRSSLVSPSSRRPASRSACATQLRIDWAVGSNSFASSSGLPPWRSFISPLRHSPRSRVNSRFWLFLPTHDRRT